MLIADHHNVAIVHCVPLCTSVDFTSFEWRNLRFEPEGGGELAEGGPMPFEQCRRQLKQSHAVSNKPMVGALKIPRYRV